MLLDHCAVAPFELFPAAASAQLIATLLGDVRSLDEGGGWSILPCVNTKKAAIFKSCAEVFLVAACHLAAVRALCKVAKQG